MKQLASTEQCHKEKKRNVLEQRYLRDITFKCDEKPLTGSWANTNRERNVKAKQLWQQRSTLTFPATGSRGTEACGPHGKNSASQGGSASDHEHREAIQRSQEHTQKHNEKLNRVIEKRTKQILELKYTMNEMKKKKRTLIEGLNIRVVQTEECELKDRTSETVQ